jgi:hypothetical protein
VFSDLRGGLGYVLLRTEDEFATWLRGTPEEAKEDRLRR